MDQTDEELVRAYYGGDSKAFEMLFVRHKVKVFNFSLRMLSVRADAEDVTSDVFIQLFGKRFKDDGRAKLTTWLFTVARNASLTKLRSIKNTVSLWFKQAGTDEYHEWDVPDPGESSSEIMDQHEQALKVKKALQALPVEQKEALILREYFQKDYQEISQILGCSLEKVKVLIFRGREALRKKILGELKEEGL